MLWRWYTEAYLEPSGMLRSRENSKASRCAFIPIAGREDLDDVQTALNCFSWLFTSHCHARIMLLDSISDKWPPMKTKRKIRQLLQLRCGQMACRWSQCVLRIWRKAEGIARRIRLVLQSLMQGGTARMAFVMTFSTVHVLVLSISTWVAITGREW